MSADEFDIRRIELDADTAIWVRGRRQPGAGEPGPPPPAVRVRPAAIVVAAVAGGIALVRFGPSEQGLLAAWVLAVLTVLAAIDLEARVLPNRIVFPGLICAIGWNAAFSPDRLVECLVAGLVAGAVLLLPSLVQPGAVGMGDVKVTAFLGIVLGADVIVALLAGSLAAAPVALSMLLVGGAGSRRTAMPFGPFLAVGAAIALLT